jgi:hypothetical protein
MVSVRQHRVLVEPASDPPRCPADRGDRGGRRAADRTIRGVFGVDRQESVLLGLARSLASEVEGDEGVEGMHGISPFGGVAAVQRR